MFLKQCLKIGIIKNFWVHIQDSSFKIGKPSWEQMCLKMPALIMEQQLFKTTKACYLVQIITPNLSYETRSGYPILGTW